MRFLFAKHQFGAVIHFAACAYVGESVTDLFKYYQKHASEPIKLLRVMQEFGCNVFVFSSPLATHWVHEKLPITETNHQNPITQTGNDWANEFPRLNAPMSVNLSRPLRGPTGFHCRIVLRRKR